MLFGGESRINQFVQESLDPGKSLKNTENNNLSNKKKVGTWRYIVSLFRKLGGGFQYLVHIFNLWCRFGVVWAIHHIQFEGFPVARKVAGTLSPIKDFLPNLSRRLFRKSSSVRQKILGWGWLGLRSQLSQTSVECLPRSTPNKKLPVLSTKDWK